MHGKIILQKYLTYRWQRVKTSHNQNETMFRNHKIMFKKKLTTEYFILRFFSIFVDFAFKYWYKPLILYRE